MHSSACMICTCLGWMRLKSIFFNEPKIGHFYEINFSGSS